MLFGGERHPSDVGYWLQAVVETISSDGSQDAAFKSHSVAPLGHAVRIDLQRLEEGACSNVGELQASNPGMVFDKYLVKLYVTPSDWVITWLAILYLLQMCKIALEASVIHPATS